MSSDWMSKADRFNGIINNERGIVSAAEVKQQRLTGDIHFKTKETISTEQKASGLYWSATPGYAPSGPSSDNVPSCCSLTGRMYRLNVNAKFAFGCQ